MCDTVFLQHRRSMFINLVVFLAVGLPLSSATITSTLKCSTSNTAGITPLEGTHINGTDNNLAFTYVAETHDYVFECCGVISKWQVMAGSVGTLQLQVWRRTSTNVYKLIGENPVAVTSIGIRTFDIGLEDRIVVQKGDLIGWHNEGDEIVLYATTHFTGSSLNNLFRRKNVGDLSPGATEDWSEVESYNDRNYGISAIYNPTSAPTVSVSATTVNVPDTMFSGGHIGNIYYSDTDFMDNSSLNVIQDMTTALISTNIASGYVSAVNSYRLRDAVLKYTVIDTCLNTATATIDVNVQTTLLNIDSLDATFTVAESVTSQTYLYTFTVTDPVDQWYCYSTWTASASFPFMLKALSTTSYGLYVTESPGFDYDSMSSYPTLGITCVENKVTGTTASTSGNIVVYLTRNQPPVLINLDDSVTVDADVVFIGDTVYTVSATDPENDVMEFSMTCTPSETSVFRMMKNGQIQVKSWLLLTAPNYYYDCDVTVTDSDSNTDLGNLQIAVSNIDYQVEILNMPPVTLEVQENTPVGTSIYKFRYHDLDTDTKTWAITSHSSGSFSRFLNLDPDSGVLTAEFSEIDYESLTPGSSHVMAITVGDRQSTDTENLNIIITNQNEAPYFPRSHYHVEINEGADGDPVFSGTTFGAVDEDLIVPANDESLTYELDCDSATQTQRFYITTTTGDIEYKGPMDFDYSGTPMDYACVVTVRDKLGLSDTTNLYIHVKNVNEFAPQFTSISYTVYVATNTLVGTQVLVVTAVDYDLDSEDELDSDITYTLDQTSIGSTKFAIKEDGSIYVAASLSTVPMGTTLGVIVALASNYETGMTGSASITIIVPGTTTTVTTTTDRDLDFYEDEWNYFWIILTLLGIALLILAVTLVCFRICRLTRIPTWCKTHCCPPKPEAPRGFGDYGYDLARFGTRHRYADEDDAVDGWIHRIRGTHSQNVETPHPPLTGDAQGWSDTSLDNGLDVSSAPIYEMFRVPSPGLPATGDEALDPLTNIRRKPIPRETWKDRKKRTALKTSSTNMFGY